MHTFVLPNEMRLFVENPGDSGFAEEFVGGDLNTGTLAQFFGFNMKKLRSGTGACVSTEMFMLCGVRGKRLYLFCLDALPENVVFAANVSEWLHFWKIETRDPDEGKRAVAHRRRSEYERVIMTALDIREGPRIRLVKEEAVPPTSALAGA